MAEIEHVVVLMLENRSFDHFLGFFPGVKGLHDPTYPVDSRVFPVKPPQGYVTSPDPGHEFPDVNLQVFGKDSPLPGDPPIMNGFVESYKNHHGPNNGVSILGCFEPAPPCIQAIALRSVVCDQWFASVPSSTWPNRFFVHAGTSGGRLDTPSGLKAVWEYERGQKGPTIFELFESRKLRWRVYYHDLAFSWVFSDLRNYPGNFQYFQQFIADVRGANLPAYSFIEPVYFTQIPNDQHPPHHIESGEDLIQTVYEELLRGPQWERTLLIILYDEHGGFYDHWPPGPTTSPDDAFSTNPPFDFRRLGVRVPALLASPLLSARIDSTMYDHTSLLKYLQEHFRLGGDLGQRTKAANTFDALFQDGPTPQASERRGVSRPRRKKGSKRRVRDVGRWSLHKQSGLALAEYLQGRFPPTEDGRRLARAAEDVRRQLRQQAPASALRMLRQETR
jgi:phospholipase C